MGTGRELRISEFTDQGDKRSIILQANYGIMLGAQDEDISETLSTIARAGIDGIIVTRGLANRYSFIFHGRSAPAMLLSLDWTNAFRGSEHPLPMARLEHIVLSSVEEALTMGASGVTTHFFIGHEDEQEASYMEKVSAICRECDDLEMPLLVQVIPVGERVTAENYVDSLAMASRMVVEAGADLLAIPYAGKEGVGRIVEASKVPVLVMDIERKISKGQPDYEIERDAPEALKAGSSGLIIGRRYLERDNASKVEKLVRLVHGG
ncbi:MAG: class I fructose-bisphosphate aldolase [Thermoproteota archaeon]